MRNTGRARGNSGSLLRRIFSAAGFPFLIAFILGAVWYFRQDLSLLFSSPQKVQAWVSSRGAAGPLVFMLLQFFQVVVFVVPGEVVQIAGGYLFGVWKGTLFSLVGIMAGSTFNFYVARLLGTPFVQTLFKPSQVEKFRTVAHSPRARVGFFLFFVIPGIPKDVLCYVAGISPMRFLVFFGISMAGRLPALVGSNFIGNAAAAQQWHTALYILAGAGVLFVLGLSFRERIHALIERVTGSRHEGRGEADDRREPDA